MKIAVIGNPVTDISTGKFLLKFSRIVSEIAQDVYVINDGRLRIKDEKIHVIRATYFNSRIRGEKKSALDAFLGFFAAQIGLTFGLFRFSCMKLKISYGSILELKTVSRLY